MSSSNMYNNYEQLQSTSSRSSVIHADESYDGSGTGITYRSAMGPRVTSSQRSRATGFGSPLSRTQQSYSSSVSGSNFGQGLASLVNVAGVAIRGGRSATYTCTTDAASLQIQSARLREKRDLVFLNDKFAQYVEKVRYLEAHNRKLAMELNYLQNRSGQGSTHLKVMYETEMQEASKLVEDAKRMAGGVHAKIVEADEELKRQKARFTSVSTSRGTDQKEFHDLLERYIESQGHIALFRRRLADLEDEIRLYKVESQRLTSEISSVQNQIRSELSLRSASDLDRASLSEQFIILKETQEAQLAELRSKLVSVDLDPSKFFRNELAMAIREIRKEYDSLVESQRSELQARYSILINEISVQTQRNETTSALTGEHYREVERMRAELLAAQNQASYFRSKVQQLQNLVSDLQLKIKAFKESSAFATSRIEQEINEAAVYLIHIEDNYKKVMALKTTLEQEIATYRLYLESADGLRGCVDRIVQSAEQKIYEQANSSNYAYASQGQDLTSDISTTYAGSSPSNYIYTGTKSSAGVSKHDKPSPTVASRSEVYSSNGLVGQSNSPATRDSVSEHSASATYKTRESVSPGYAAARQYTKQANTLRNGISSSHENLSQHTGSREASQRRTLLSNGVSTSCGSVSLENSLNEQ
ncbi:unnamed protein product [Rotaria magnacalcarata]|uniref:IF rod domain-containing protein n=1 Tax=Rotaria magnacalcarata TaxID=392030 RepID=A0A816G0Q1_9BILA|nr:unnamed protein product [Rotaria magnacalcarata]